MRRMDRIYTSRPVYGSRRMAEELKAEGHQVGRKRVRRLMCEMGLEALYPKPRLSDPNPQHKKYPYLLRNLEIQYINQVWSSDITYLPLGEGHVYLAAVMDWSSRYILSWRLSNTLDSHFCVDALNEALRQYGNPQIFNTDQGSQFTSADFCQTLQKHKIQISMDGRGRALDNRMIERFWRTIKYEDIYLNAYEDLPRLRKGIKAFIHFYSHERRHQSLDNKTPYQIYKSGININNLAA